MTVTTDALLTRIVALNTELNISHMVTDAMMLVTIALMLFACICSIFLWKRPIRRCWYVKDLMYGAALFGGIFGICFGACVLWEMGISYELDQAIAAYEIVFGPLPEGLLD